MAFVCQKCNKEYKTRRGMDNHIKKGCQLKENIKIKKYQCDLCNIDFDSHLEMKRHMELNICDKFLQNNSYCYVCHLELGSHELLVQHEFSQEHYQKIQEGYTPVTSLQIVKKQLQTIADNSLSTQEIFPITHQENEIQEELMRMEDELIKHEKELEKEKIKKQQKKERNKLKKEKAEKQKQLRQKRMDAFLSGNVVNKKSKMIQIEKAPERKPEAELKNGFQFVNDEDETPTYKEIKIGDNKNNTNNDINDNYIVNNNNDNINNNINNKINNIKSFDLDLDLDLNLNIDKEDVIKEIKLSGDEKVKAKDINPKMLVIEKDMEPVETEDVIEKKDIIEPKKMEMVKQQSYDRQIKRDEYYGRRMEDMIEDYSEVNSVHYYKKYIDSYNIISLQLYQKLMSNLPPALQSIKVDQKLSSSEMASQINNMLGTRQQEEMFFKQVLPHDERLVQSKKVSKTDANTFGHDMDLVLQQRSQQKQELIIPKRPDLATPGMALPSQEADKLESSEFKKQMDKIMADRNNQDVFLKETVKSQPIIDKLPTDKDKQLEGLMASSMDMSHMQQPGEKPDRNLCQVMGMYDGKSNVTEDVEYDLEKELKEMSQLRDVTIRGEIPNNKTSMLPPIGRQNRPGNQKENLSQLLGSTKKIDGININITKEEDTSKYDLGSELQQVSMEINKMPTPHQQPISIEEKEKRRQAQLQAENKAKEMMELQRAKQMDASVMNRIWIIMHRVINQPNMEQNMMTILIDCRIEEYPVVHQFITNSKQLMIEKQKKKTLIASFNGYHKFINKKLKKGEYLVKGKSIKQMLTILSRLKF